MNLKILIWTTEKDFWMAEDFDAIKQTVGRGKGIGTVTIDIRFFTASEIGTTTRKDKVVRPDWKWFKETFTAHADGYNAVCFHFTSKEKKLWGIKGISGVYNNDPDRIFEFVVIADKGKMAKKYKRRTDFWRIFVHELGHGFMRVTGKKSNLVHVYDYKKHNLDAFYRKEVDVRKA